MVIFAARLRNSGKFIDNIERLSTSKYRETLNSRALISLEIESVGKGLRDMRYTMKSSILAQDER